MPVRPNPWTGDTTASAGMRQNPWTTPAEPEAPTEDAGTGNSWGDVPTALLAAGGIGAAALLAKKLGLTNIRNAGNYVNSLRQQSMLSGLAPVKSFLGNVGAAVEQSALRRSMDPLKEFLSMNTVNDAINSYKANSVPTGMTKFPDWLPTPGRVMQALDDATQGALRRAGLSGDEAQSAVMQAPLPAKLQQALDSPVGRYMIPFRRTPFNQFMEGFGRFTKEGYDPIVTPAYVATGAAHGAATSEDKAPMSLPLAIAASATHGVPYALGAIGGRVLAQKYSGGPVKPPDTQTVASILPVSEYGITQSIGDPFAPFEDPAALVALRKILGQ